MQTTFTVISLGNLSDIDTFEGNTTAENAAALVGQSFGGPGNALFNNAVTWSPVGNPRGVYNMNNAISNDQFSIDGGPPQTVDGTAVYQATLTYSDGSTDTFSAVIVQDTTGNTYLAPELSDNADQAALEAKPIQSISLDGLAGNRFSGLGSVREDWDLVTCFTTGTRIETETGIRAIETIRVGDEVRTLDHGFQPVRWIGQRTVRAEGAFAPVLFKAHALGNTRDLRVSQQHRVLLNDFRVELYSGFAEALAPAKHLVNGVDIMLIDGGMVTYVHLMFDQHELIWSEGCLTESFHPGAQGWNSLDRKARSEILSLFPELQTEGLAAYGPTARPLLARSETQASVG
ncbi:MULTISPECIES: Hint domain-containing protein [unclassified Ruegeria]|uniref:Hint domain-containing protein n=1 Tax=unclassified Ruegeria TaxID=2625375 RepID=UPI00148801D1